MPQALQALITMMKRGSLSPAFNIQMKKKQARLPRAKLIGLIRRPVHLFRRGNKEENLGF